MAIPYLSERILLHYSPGFDATDGQDSGRMSTPDLTEDQITAGIGPLQRQRTPEITRLSAKCLADMKVRSML